MPVMGSKMDAIYVVNAVRLIRIYNWSHDIVVVNTTLEVLRSSTTEDTTVWKKSGENAHDARVTDHIDATQYGWIVVQGLRVLAEANSGSCISIKELHRA